MRIKRRQNKVADFVFAAPVQRQLMMHVKAVRRISVTHTVQIAFGQPQLFDQFLFVVACQHLQKNSTGTAADQLAVFVATAVKRRAFGFSFGNRRNRIFDFF